MEFIIRTDDESEFASNISLETLKVIVTGIVEIRNKDAKILNELLSAAEVIDRAMQWELGVD